MQLAFVNCPAIATKIVLSGVSSLVLGSLNTLYDTLGKSNASESKEIERKIRKCHIKSDLEIIGSLLSELFDDNLNSKTLNVCVEHMHTCLKELNEALTTLDKRLYYNSWFFTSSSNLSMLVENVIDTKLELDHLFGRLVQIKSIL